MFDISMNLLLLLTERFIIDLDGVRVSFITQDHVEYDLDDLSSAQEVKDAGSGMNYSQATNSRRPLVIEVAYVSITLYNPFSAPGTDFICQNITSVDVRF